MNAVPSTTTLLLAILAALALGGVIWFVVLRRRDLEQRVEEFQALSDAVQAIASATLDETALCALVHEQAARLMDARTFQLGFFDGADYDLRVRVVRGQSAKVGRFEIGHPGGIIGWMRDTGKPLLVRDFRRELDALPALPRSLDGDAEGLPRSGVFVPMLAGDAVIGALAIQSDQPNAYTDRHLRVLSIIANLAAAAVQNARALARERKRATQLGLIDTVAYRTASLLDLDTLLTTLVEAIQGAYGYAYVGLYLSDRVTGEVECRAATHPLEVGLRRPPGAGLIGTAITDGKTLRVNDVSADARFLATPNLRDTRSEAVVPLYLENKVIGALDLQSGQTNAFLSEDQAYLEALAQVVAVAVGNAQLYEAEREQAWQSAAMLQVADAARSAQSFEEASESVATVTQLLGGVEACGLLLRNADGRYRIAAVRGQLSDHERLTPGDVILTEDIPALALMEASRAPAWSDEPG
ncbi:MAG: GAF domain-containing protein, partial [Thermoflexales bacterium]|nr:GAF domain-containing protein [Thermoflexales bacterium]